MRLEFDLTKEGSDVAQYSEKDTKVLGRLYLNRTAAILLFGAVPQSLEIQLEPRTE